MVPTNKYGPYIREELGHYLQLGRELDGSLVEATNLIVSQKPSQVNTQLVNLSQIVMDTNCVVFFTISEGFHANAMHELRYAQEASMKMAAFQKRPNMATKRESPPGAVRETLNMTEPVGWKRCYKELSQASHLDRDFVLAYSYLNPTAPITQIGKLFVDYHLALLYLIDLVALYALTLQMAAVGEREHALRWRTKYEELQEAVWRVYSAADQRWTEFLASEEPKQS